MKSTIHHFQTAETFYQKDKWDLDSWFEITQIDYKELLKQYPFQNLFAGLGKSQINLLDIGCGVGKFPSLLDGVFRAIFTYHRICSMFQLLACK